MKKVKVVDLTCGREIKQIALDEAERKAKEALKRGYVVLVDGEFLKWSAQARRILESAKEVYIVPPIAGG